jgi:hypothetical protein
MPTVTDERERLLRAMIYNYALMVECCDCCREEACAHLHGETTETCRNVLLAEFGLGAEK